jgi:hypothetical protein
MLTSVLTILLTVIIGLYGIVGFAIGVCVTAMMSEDHVPYWKLVSTLAVVLILWPCLFYDGKTPLDYIMDRLYTYSKEKRYEDHYTRPEN